MPGCFSSSLPTGELGHLVVARLGGIEAPSLVVGVGPCLAACEVHGTRIEVRLLPLLGWVLLDDIGVRARPGRAIILSLAGPVANLLLCVGLVSAAIAWAQGPSAVGVDFSIVGNSLEWRGDGGGLVGALQTSGRRRHEPRLRPGRERWQGRSAGLR